MAVPVSRVPLWQNQITSPATRTLVPLEFCLLQGETAEAFDAWRKGREVVGAELAARLSPVRLRPGNGQRRRSSTWSASYGICGTRREKKLPRMLLSAVPGCWNGER